MKKIIALGLTGVMIMATLTGCGKRSEYLLDVDYSKYVKLCEYKEVEATKVVYDVTDAEVKEEAEYAMYDYATYDEIKDRGVEVGDYANITYTTTIDGVEDEYYSGEEDEIMVGEGFLYPELENALVGMKPGEKKTVEVELTEEYVEEEYVGKIASIDVTLNKIMVENIPEYNLDFVKENTEFDSLEAYEESLKVSLMESKEEEYRYISYETIMAYLIENSEFDGYPDELYIQCEEMYDSNNELYASMYGVSLEEFLEMYGIDEETKKQEIEASVNYELIIGAIAQKEGIDCTKKDIEKYVDDNYEDYGYETADEFLEDYSEEDIGYELLYQKVMDFLYENATFTEMSEEEYLAGQEEYYYEDSEVDSEESVDEDAVSIEDLEIGEEFVDELQIEADTEEEENSETEPEEVSTEE